MSKPEPGIYFIYNKVLSPSSDKLAITFNGQGAIATLTPIDYDSSPQKWTIKEFGDGITQTISPTANPYLQAAWGADGVSVVLPSRNYVWNIRNTDNGYTLKTGVTTWGVAEAKTHVKVTLGDDTGSDKQRWIFVRYD